jgi:hypothetical protein
VGSGCECGEVYFVLYCKIGGFVLYEWMVEHDSLAIYLHGESPNRCILQKHAALINAHHQYCQQFPSHLISSSEHYCLYPLYLLIALHQ